MWKPRQGRVNAHQSGKRESSPSCPIPQSITVVRRPHLSSSRHHHRETTSELPAPDRRPKDSIRAPVDSSRRPEYRPVALLLLRRCIIGQCTAHRPQPLWHAIHDRHPDPDTHRHFQPHPPRTTTLRLQLAPAHDGIPQQQQQRRPSRPLATDGHGQAGRGDDGAVPPGAQQQTHDRAHITLPVTLVFASAARLRHTATAAVAGGPPDVCVPQEYPARARGATRCPLPPLQEHVALALEHARAMGEPWPARRGPPRHPARADLQRGRGGEPDLAGRSREHVCGQEGCLGLPRLRRPGTPALVQAVVLLVGQQPGVFAMLLANRRRRHHPANAGRASTRRQPGRGLSVFARRLRQLRALPTIQRRLRPAADAERPMWRVGQLLQHALPRRRIKSALGLERRGPRLDRSLLCAPEAMGSRRRLRRGVGQAPVIH
jgi:hypothetical protein